MDFRDYASSPPLKNVEINIIIPTEQHTFNIFNVKKLTMSYVESYHKQTGIKKFNFPLFI